MTREEFESIQRKFQESGLGIMQFLRQEKINHSTFSKWRRRYQAENLEVVKSEETLAPVSISHTNCNNVIQPTLFDDEFLASAAEVQQARDEAAASITQSTQEKKQERKNRKMIEDLPVLERVVIEPENIDLNLYKKIGEEVTRVVEHKPGQLYVKEIIRPKYGLKDNTSLLPAGKKAIEIAFKTLLPIYKGIAGPTLLSEVLLQKYEYHLPFYRQIQEFKHLGFKISESTLAGWFKPTVELLKPLYEVLKSEIMKSDYLQGDETTVPVVDKEKQKTNKEYLWLVIFRFLFYF